MLLSSEDYLVVATSVALQPSKEWFTLEQGYVPPR